jgi:hypothetical protein
MSIPFDQFPNIGPEVQSLTLAELAEGPRGLLKLIRGFCVEVNEKLRCALYTCQTPAAATQPDMPHQESELASHFNHFLKGRFHAQFLSIDGVLRPRNGLRVVWFLCSDPRFLLNFAECASKRGIFGTGIAFDLSPA